MRSAIGLGLSLATAWLLGGCTEPEDTTSGGGSSSTAAASSDGSSTADPGSSGPGPGSSGDPGTTSSVDSTGSTTASADSTTSGSSSGSADSNGVCEPPAPAGDACLECVTANCCGVWMNCQADEACACVIDCHVVQGNSLGMCGNACNLETDLYQAVYFCGQASCLGSCDWDCC